MEVNWIGVIAAAISAFVLGGVWYGPLFGRKWMELVGLSEDQAKSASMAKIFGGALILSFLAAFVFAMFLGPDIAPQQGAIYGFSAGLFWVGGTFGINYLFAQRPLGLWLIDAGYATLQFTLYGLLIGLFA